MISIIIPTLNEEKLLPNLLRQLCAKDLLQKFQYEIIISDGGSTDKTLSIGRSFNVKVVSEPLSNAMNIASGRNYGARFASGDILMFMNADVLLHEPEQFFTFITNRFNGTEYAALTCHVEVFPEETGLSDRIFHSFYNNYFRAINVLGIGMGRGECQIIRKEIFDKINGYAIHLVAGEDFDLFKRAAKLGKIFFAKQLRVFESPRRYRKYGYVRVALSWTLNAFSILKSNKSNSNTWEQVR